MNKVKEEDTVNMREFRENQIQACLLEIQKANKEENQKM
jgi:hypothetical protein